MRQKIVGFFNTTITKSTAIPSDVIGMSDIDRLLIHNSRKPIGTTLQAEKASLEKEISDLGPEAVKVRIEKEALFLEELNKKIEYVNKESEQQITTILSQSNPKSTMKEKMKAAYQSIRDLGLDSESNRGLYETHGTLKRRQMVLKEHPNLLNLDYTYNVAHTNQ